MASTYENDLRLEEMATGENSGSWGTKTNTNLELIADAFSYGTETIADADTTITIADGAADAARSLALKINSSADLTTTRTITLAPNTTSKVWIIENNTSGGQTLTISAGSGSNVTLANGTTKIIATDGIGAGSNVVELTQDLAIADMSVDGILSLADGSNSAPSLTNTGDTNTGLYFPAADEVGITTGGTQRVKVDSTGVDITGTLVSDGLTVDKTATISTTDYYASSTFSSTLKGAATNTKAALLLNSVSSSGQNAFASIHSEPIADFRASLIGTYSADGSGAGHFSVKQFLPTSSTTLERMRIDQNGDITFYDTDGTTASFVYDASAGTTFNEAGADRDFRVESDNNSNMLFVDAGNDRVQVNSVNPQSTTLVSVRGNGNNIEWGHNNTTSGYYGVLGANNNNGNPFIAFSANANSGTSNTYDTDGFIGTILRGTTGGELSIEQTLLANADNQTPVQRLGISATEIVINEASTDTDFRVESDTNTHALFVDASTDNVGIHDSAPTSTLTVQGNKAFSWNANGTDNVATVTVGQRSTSNNVNSFAVAGTTHNSYYPSSWVVDSSHDGVNNLTTFNLTAYGVKFGGWNSRMTFNTTQGTAVHEALRVRNTEAVFNELSNNTDFRVESDGISHMLFVDASKDAVTINGNTVVADGIYNYPLSVGANTAADAIAVVGRSSDDISEVGFYENDGTTQLGNLQARVGSMRLRMLSNGGAMQFENNDSGGNLRTRQALYNTEAVFNDGSFDYDFRVESDALTHALFVDAGNNLVSIGSGTPYQSGRLEVFAQNDLSSEGISINGVSSATSFRLYTVGNMAKIGRGGDHPSISIDGANNVIINDDSENHDFRVESENNSSMLFVNAEKDTVRLGSGGGNSAPLSFHKDKSSRYYGKFIDSTSDAAAKVATLMTIDSWQSGNSRLFGTVTFWSVNPIGDYANHGRASFFAKNTTSGTGNTVTTFTELEEKGSMALPTLTWTGTGLRTLTFNMPAVAYQKYIVDITFITADGATTTLYDDAATGVDP